MGIDVTAHIMQFKHIVYVTSHNVQSLPSGRLHMRQNMIDELVCEEHR